MANREFRNTGYLFGEYNGVDLDGSPSSEVLVTLINAEFLKEADRAVWSSGELTLTLTIDNSVGDGPMTNIIMRDTLDETRFEFIEGSVIVQMTEGGTTTTLVEPDDYTAVYTSNPGEDSGELEVTFVEDGAASPIPVGAVVTISFRGEKVEA